MAAVQGFGTFSEVSRENGPEFCRIAEDFSL